MHTSPALPADSRFAKFLRQAHDDPHVIDLLQEQCGMTLLPGVYSQAAWWHGVAGSGKSTLAEIVEAMHRQVARCNLKLGDRFSLEPMIGASLILVDEVECEKWAEGRFKTMVSGNGIGIDRKNQKQLASYHSTAKWIITSTRPLHPRQEQRGVAPPHRRALEEGGTGQPARP
jgi:phage/plasmid-associated DNA primase